jgi:uncharacterized protein YdhG (YjbR/CyaY superfamily)
MPTKPKTIDEYLARLSNDKRVALQKLRKDIKSAAPKAEEVISYGVPGFRLNGKLLVSFATATNHVALYTGAHPIEAHRKELEGYDTSKGTIRFQTDDPLPTTLVRKLVKTRVAEYSAKPRKKR